MRRVLSVVAAVILPGVGAWAGQDMAQTPRQALMEMFFSKEPGTFMKHLPARQWRSSR
jgi:hypothetical protein